VFWGGDGFAFEVPGRHRVEVIVLWTVAGVPVAANGAADLFVAYPVSETDNTMAALLLDPEVGRAVAVGDASRFGGGADRIRSALASDERHPACQALRRIGVVETVPEAEDGDG
jgi:hypothetical protein